MRFLFCFFIGQNGNSFRLLMTGNHHLSFLRHRPLQLKIETLMKWLPNRRYQIKLIIKTQHTTLSAYKRKITLINMVFLIYFI